MDLELQRLEAEFNRHYNNAVATGDLDEFAKAIDAEKVLGRYRELTCEQRVAAALGFAFQLNRTILTALRPFPFVYQAVSFAVRRSIEMWRNR